MSWKTSVRLYIWTFPNMHLYCPNYFQLGSCIILLLTSGTFQHFYLAKTTNLSLHCYICTISRVKQLNSTDGMVEFAPVVFLRWKAYTNHLVINFISHWTSLWAVPLWFLQYKTSIPMVIVRALIDNRRAVSSLTLRVSWRTFKNNLGRGAW